MTEISFEHPYSKRLTFVLTIVAALALQEVYYRRIGLGVAAFFLILPFAFLNLWKHPSKIRIIEESKSIQVVYSRLSFRSQKSFSLKNLSHVHSYITSGRSPVNVVELKALDRSETLKLSIYEARWKGNGFLSIPVTAEVEAAANLRKRLAMTGLFIDAGFSQMGTRPPSKEFV